MMSGTQLVLLAMYSTVNVVGPAGMRISTDLVPLLVCLLIAAAVMTFLLMQSLSSLPERFIRPVPKQPRLLRRHGGPAPRRV